MIFISVIFRGSEDLTGTWDLSLDNGHETQLVIFDNNNILIADGLTQDSIAGQQLQFTKDITARNFAFDTIDGLTLFDEKELVGRIELTTASTTLLEGILFDNNGNIYQIKMQTTE